MEDLIEIRQASTTDEYDVAATLFKAYAEWLGFSLCFQGFDQELLDLPGRYGPPDGYLLIAWAGSEPVGCGAIKRQDDRTCEMKRLYLDVSIRGRGVGRRIAEALIREALSIGYERIRLDTIGERMKTAVGLYKSLGFREIPAYYFNPEPGVVYMELDLIEYPDLRRDREQPR